MTASPLAVLGRLLADRDAELLARFARLRDGAAFELLVWRHAGAIPRAGRSVARLGCRGRGARR